MELLPLLRAQLVFPLVLFAVCLLLARYLRSRAVSSAVVAVTIVFALIAALGAALGIWGHMLSSSLATTAVAWLHGQPLYPSAGAAERYALLYGPLAYLAYVPAAFVSSDLRAFQLWTAVPAATTVLAIWKLTGGLKSAAARALVVLQASVVLITFAMFEWAPRADIWIVCFCALGLVVVEMSETALSVIGMAFAGAAVLDLKFSTILLALFPVLLYWKRTKRLGHSLLSFGLILLVSASVFFLPRVSLRNYAYWFRASAEHGMDKPLILMNVLGALNIFLIPLFLLGWLYVRRKEDALRLMRKHSAILAAIAVVTVFSVLTGAKRGAGPWHCVPLVPIACLCTIRLLGEAQRLFAGTHQPAILQGVVASLALAVTVLGAKNLRVIIPSYKLGVHPLSSDVAADLHEIMIGHRGQDIEMGYGLGRYELSWQRSILVGNGSRFTLDVDSLSDQELSGLAMPAATLDYIDRCAADVWLVPKGEQPFMIENFYWGESVNVPEQVFSPAFRRSFAQHYRLSGQSRFYDLYECRKPGS